MIWIGDDFSQPGSRWRDRVASVWCNVLVGSQCARSFVFLSFSPFSFFFVPFSLSLPSFLLDGVCFHPEPVTTRLSLYSLDAFRPSSLPPWPRPGLAFFQFFFVSLTNTHPPSAHQENLIVRDDDGTFAYVIRRLPCRPLDSRLC